MVDFRHSIAKTTIFASFLEWTQSPVFMFWEIWAIDNIITPFIGGAEVETILFFIFLW